MKGLETKIKSYLMWVSTVFMALVFKSFFKIKDFMFSPTPLSFFIWIILISFFITFMIGTVVLIEMFLL